MLNKQRKTRWWVLVCGITVLVSGDPLWALSVSPGRTEILLTPGRKTTYVLTVMNDAPEKVNVEVSKRDWFVLDANKGLQVDAWLKINGNPTFTLKPGQHRKVKVTASCPKTAQGELVGMVSFTYRTIPPSNVTPIISVSVYVAAAGTERVAGNITAVGLRRLKDQLQVAVGVQATGNVHLRPSGHVLILDAKGAQLADLTVQEGTPTYPGTTHGYVARMPGGLTLNPGQYTAKADLRYRDLELKASQDFAVSKEGQIEPVKEMPH